jgi:hypothetical protein
VDRPVRAEAAVVERPEQGDAEAAVGEGVEDGVRGRDEEEQPEERPKRIP